jgi:hypothetical protein
MKTTIVTASGSKYVFEDGLCTVTREASHHMGSETFQSAGFRTLLNTSDQPYAMVTDVMGTPHVFTSRIVEVITLMEVAEPPCDCGCHLPGIDSIDLCCPCQMYPEEAPS